MSASVHFRVQVRVTVVDKVLDWNESAMKIL